MLKKLLDTYGDMLIDELSEEIEDTGTFNIDNYYPNNGSVSGLVYYEDTEPIGKELMDEFLEVTEEFGYTCEQINKLAQGNIYNFVAWFMWEYLLSNFKEEVIEYVKKNT